MKESRNKCDIQSCYLCKLCLTDWHGLIGLHKKNFTLKKGQQVFKEGDPVTGIYFIYAGVVKVHKQWDREKELIIRFAKRGDVLGHLGLGKDPIYPVSITALEPTVLCYIDMAFFESTLKVNGQLTYNLMKFFAGELQESEKRMSNLAHMPVKPRLAQALLALQKQFGLNESGFINIELTRQDLASFAGASYETVFKVLNEFIHYGLISVSGKSILISDEDKLFQMVEEHRSGLF